MQKSLLDKTLELARASDGSIRQICRDIRVSTEWYHKLMAGKIHDPGVRRVQRLHDYLASRAGVGGDEEAAA